MKTYSEQKYIITEKLALEIRAFGSTCLKLDDHGVGKVDFSYPVSSFYLDSPDFKLYWATINDSEDQLKLRLRCYDDDATAPLYFEIKQHLGKRRVKRRALVRRDIAAELLLGRVPQFGELLSSNRIEFHTLNDFCRLRNEMGAVLKVHTAYLREAYEVVNDSSTRLTMDRRVSAEPRFDSTFSTRMSNPVLVWGNDVALELKFGNRKMPEVFQEVVGAFGLRRCSAGKYVDGMALLGL